ncbi:MAG: restriction endonuclease subunit S [Proteobacteria bacterium]|nr:restriction endonuclease subunit S [Pseudomonadota bacterium]MBU4581116.1 restriction endonuclease subunit S [Pseudomonadota bacterium]MCG2739700.1 restriction endonuclease subunit S [Syntrophaceae bacterium]
MKYGLTETTVENICAVFARFPEIEKAILYGSRAKGNFKTGSDIDLTLCGEALTSDLCSTIASELDDLLLPYTIDLSVFNEINHAKLREHIERVGVLFYERANQSAAMKKGWQTKMLVDTCEVFADGDWVESKDQSPEGIRLIQTGNVGEGVFKNRGEKARYISEATFKRLRCTEIFEGDCLISRLPDPVGRSCILPDTGERMITAVDCTIVRFNPKQLIPEFFNYFSQSLDYLKAVEAETTGTTRKRISRSKLGQVAIPVPPLPEQQRIVGILDEAFDGIATAKANAEKNLQNTRALFESHLQSVFTQRGEGWVKKRLEGLGMIRTGKRDANYQVENGPYPFYTCAFGQFRSPTFSFDGASIILPGNGANVGKVFFYDGKFEAYQRTYVVNELSGTINPRFLFYCFTAGWAEYIATKQFGSATNYIVVGGLKSFPVPIPSLSVQEATVAHLDSIAAETQRLESIYQQKLTALEALKKSLLNQAFTGEL